MILRCKRVDAVWLLWSTFLGCCLLTAQDQTGASSSQPTINTDRPAITDSSRVVLRGYLLFENGFTETGNHGQSGFDFPETLLRVGIASKTELRFAAPDYFQNFNNGRGFGSGWGDLSLGLKQQLVTTAAGLDASLVVALSFPTGANILSSHGYDPLLQLPWSRPIYKNWTAAGMFSAAWPTEGNRRNVTGQASFLVDRQLTGRWDTFVEYGGYFPQRGGPVHILHSGMSIKITRNQQIDFHFGAGLSSSSVDHFIGFGYSFQFQPFRRERHDGS
jgi:Putative MetA-pathway of phenol degradation